MRRPIPHNANIQPMKSHAFKYEVVPIISKPLIIPITTDTLSLCISFTVSTTVNSTVAPQISITNHCQIAGTMIWLAGKNIGMKMLAKKIN